MIRARALSAALACGVAAAMIGAGVGEASSTPAVTGAASGVTSSLAQLGGTVYPDGIASFWAFQYGTSADSYDHSTPPIGPVSGTGPVSVATLVRGLQPQTTYHFRLVAVRGAAGTSGEAQGYVGADASFTTAEARAVPSAGQRHAWASMPSRRVSVRGAAAIMVWRCSGTPGTVCKGTVTIWVQHHNPGVIDVVRCGTASIQVRPGQDRKVRAHLTAPCLTLLRQSPGHRLGGTFDATFSAGQGTTSAPVVLVLRRRHR